VITGFIGSGTITGHIVRGMQGSALAGWPVVLSPRGQAQTLAGLPGVRVAAGNQQVLDAADLIVLALRPQVAEAALAGLVFDPEKPVVSLIAATALDRLAAWTGARHICRAIPLPFVERLTGVTPVFPPLAPALRLFGALGQALPVGDLAAFDAYATASALMGPYFGIVETAATWMQAQGIAEADATTYLRHLFGDLGQSLVHSTTSPAALRADHSTRGGLNEQVHQVFQAAGGAAALEAGLNAVMARVRGA
jgi:pyrroline-5-carboxylate reductase